MAKAAKAKAPADASSPAQPAGRRRPQDADLAPFIALVANGSSLRGACERLGLDPPSTHVWLNADEHRRQQYAGAREARADGMAEEVLTLTRAAALGRKVRNPETGEEVKLDRDGLRTFLDAVKWAAGRMAPKPRVLEHTGPGGGPLQTVDLTGMSDDDLKRLDAALGGVLTSTASEGAEDPDPSGA